jgi:hypothetical protein
MSDYTEKWIKFLDPENLKNNLLFSSLYVASFESLKDYIVSEVKGFYLIGFENDKYIYDSNYDNNVKSKDKSIVKSSLLWLLENEAILESDILLYDELRQYRNKLSHELMTLLFDGLPEELPVKFTQLISLRIKIEKWWVLNFEIPINSDFDNKELTEDDIITSSQMLNQIILDMLSGDEKKANYYKTEFISKFRK